MDTTRPQNILFQLLIVSFCIQWISLGTVGGLQVRLSYPITALLAVSLLMRAKPKIFSQSIYELHKTSPALSLGLYILVFATLAANLIWGEAAIGVTEIARLGANVATGLVAFAYMRDCTTDRHRFSTVAILCFIATSYLLLVPFAQAGGDLPGALRAALINGDNKAIIFGVFRTAFIESGSEIEQANFRHGVASSMVFAMLLTMIPGRKRSQLESMVGWLGVAGCGAWVLLSFSRSAWTVLAIPALYASMAPALAGRLSNTGVLARFAVASALPAIGTAGILASFWDRIADPASYGNRVGRYGAALGEMSGRTLAGGPALDDQRANAHNILTEAWIAGGVLAAVGAGLILASSIKLLWQAGRDGIRLQQPIGLSAVVIGLLASPIVRMLTSGNPLLQGSNWASWGAACGILAALRMSPGPPDTSAGARVGATSVRTGPIPL